jgi:CheY-like chemotaxis protein
MSLAVLVADDDAVTLDLVSETLERLGYTVFRAEDGTELLQEIAEHGPFGLVVTDVSMPWMTGLQVAHSVRAAGLVTPVIVMTALPIDASLVRALGTASLLLRKPFTTKELVEAVSHLERGSHRRHA